LIEVLLLVDEILQTRVSYLTDQGLRILNRIIIVLDMVVIIHKNANPLDFTFVLDDDVECREHAQNFANAPLHFLKLGILPAFLVDSLDVPRDMGAVRIFTLSNLLHDQFAQIYQLFVLEITLCCALARPEISAIRVT